MLHDWGEKWLCQYGIPVHPQLLNIGQFRDVPDFQTTPNWKKGQMDLHGQWGFLGFFFNNFRFFFADSS